MVLFHTWCYSVPGVISGVCKGVNFVRGVWRNLNCIIPTKVDGEDEKEKWKPIVEQAKAD